MSETPQEPHVAKQELSKQELTERERALWQAELEWQRQNPNPDLSDFHARLERELRRRGAVRLPGLDIAMWPESFSNDIDVSNPDKFNDRFIELPVEEYASGFVKWFIGAHNFIVIIAIYAFLVDGRLEPFIVACSIVAIIFWPLIFLVIYFSGKGTSGGIRYNRQAQLVHVDDGEGRVAHIPWRQVVPIVSVGVAPSSLMQLCAPFPHARMEYYKLLEIGRDVEAFRSAEAAEGPFGLRNLMAEGDHASAWSNLQRLEFLRRYMADGIAAIQPDPELVAKGRLYDTETFGDPRNMRQLDWFWKYVMYPIDRAWHYLAFGPWLDKRARARAEAFRWTQEVEDLCGPNPDLRGLDTRPIKARTDFYYRPDGVSAYLVDRNGNRLPRRPAKT